MPSSDVSKSFYFFDIDDNLLFLPTRIYLWNPMHQVERAVSSGEFAEIHGLGQPGPWHGWTVRDESFRDFRDLPGPRDRTQPFVQDLIQAMTVGNGWMGPAWPLLVHAAEAGREIALVTARGHHPETIRAGLDELVTRKLLPKLPPNVDIYTVTHQDVRDRIGATDPNMPVPEVKKLAIRHAVDEAAQRWGQFHRHRFGMSDDDPKNVALAVLAMRECKLKYPHMRFFVINTNKDQYVKLEIFLTTDRPTATDRHVLTETTSNGLFKGGCSSVYVGDWERAITFYRDVLGLRERMHILGEWAEFEAGGGFVIGLHPSGPGTASPSTPGAVNVELAVTRPLEEVQQALTRKGARFDGTIRRYPNVELLNLLDPDGNTIVLAYQPPRA